MARYPRKMTLDQEVLACRLYREGKSVATIAGTFDVSVPTIYAVLRRHQVEMRGHRAQPVDAPARQGLDVVAAYTDPVPAPLSSYSPPDRQMPAWLAYVFLVALVVASITYAVIR